MYELIVDNIIENLIVNEIEHFTVKLQMSVILVMFPKT